MENLILDNISLVILLPLWIFLIIMCGRFFSVYVNIELYYLKYGPNRGSSLYRLSCRNRFPLILS